MSRPVLATDADLERDPETPDLPTLRPYGHFIGHSAGKNWAIVSHGHGRLAELSSPEDAQPWLRMLMRDCHRGRRRLDYALWYWCPQIGAWTIYQRTVPMHELGLGSDAEAAA